MAGKIEQALDVVGIPYRGFKRPERQVIADMLRKSSLRCDLQREPTNPADTSAIQVVLSDPKAKQYDGRVLGYLRSPVAQVLAPRLDEGTVEVVSCKLTALFAADDNKSGNVDLVIEEGVDGI